MPSKPAYGTDDLRSVEFRTRIEGKLDDILEQVKTALKLLERHDEQIRSLEMRMVVSERESTSLQQRDTALDLRVRSVEQDIPDNLRKTIDTLTEAVNKFSPFVSAFKWLASAVGLLVLALIWQIITGQFSLLRAP